MTEPLDSWDSASAFARSLPGTELSTSYGKPAIKVNGRAFLFVGREEESSFGIALDLDSIELLMETDPASFWQTPHYQGWPALLVRFDSNDSERVRDTIRRSHAWTAAKPRPRARKA